MKRNFKDASYIRWRKAVIQRDKYCKYPGCKKRRSLQAHHIIPWSRAALLRFCVSNGITLCWDCHNKIRGKEHLYVEMFKTILANDRK